MKSSGNIFTSDLKNKMILFLMGKINYSYINRVGKTLSALNGTWGVYCLVLLCSLFYLDIIHIFGGFLVVVAKYVCVLWSLNCVACPNYEVARVIQPGF